MSMGRILFTVWWAKLVTIQQHMNSNVKTVKIEYTIQRAEF